MNVEAELAHRGMFLHKSPFLEAERLAECGDCPRRREKVEELIAAGTVTQLIDGQGHVPEGAGGIHRIYNQRPNESCHISDAPA